jgi:hypothetical protein
VARYDTICPHCSYKHDSVSLMDEKFAMPNDGDVTICIECGHLSIFELLAKGGLREPTLKEYKVLMKDRRVVDMMAAWIATNQMRRRSTLQ